MGLISLLPKNLIRVGIYEEYFKKPKAGILTLNNVKLEVGKMIYAKKDGKPDNVSRLMIVVTPKTQIAENDVITIKIKANTTEPYKKEISCEVSLRVKQVVLNSYSIDDVTNRNYAILKLVNAKETGMPVYVSDSALSCVALGTGIAVEHVDIYKKGFMAASNRL